MKKARLFISGPALPSDLVDLHQFIATLLSILRVDVRITHSISAPKNACNTAVSQRRIPSMPPAAPSITSSKTFPGE